MCTANTKCLVDDGDERIGLRRVCKRNDFCSQKVRKTANGRISTWRTQVDSRMLRNDGLGVWSAARVPALRTLSLWQQLIDLFDQRVT